ncbi:MAG: hypothetical protein K0U98_26435 [Deltaproteobacteria bacterium]|nr:hypothetical protein [Deltaproteobacteria bacterium]
MFPRPLPATISWSFLGVLLTLVSSPTLAIEGEALTFLEVPPVETDNRIDDFFENHLVARGESLNLRERLFVFLPGSFGRPDGNRLLLREAALVGYHVIGLRYPNRWTVGGLCGNNANRRCFDQVRSEILSGRDRSNLVDVSRINSVENRLEKLLEYLDREFPQGGWGQYLTADGAVEWTRTVMAGHSQGGGHAALWGRDKLLAGVLMFGAPVDFSRRYERVAQWPRDSRRTPASRYFGFAHEDDNRERMLAVWRALEVDAFGEVVTVDSISAPYEGSHLLSTRAEPALPNRQHGSVAVDAAVPLDSQGEPLFRPVWQHLLNSVGQGVPLGSLADRFEVTAAWRRPNGSFGAGVGVPLSADSGYFWFFRPENVELVIKVLDGCSVTGSFWVLAGGLTNVEVEILIRDLETGLQTIYRNPPQTPFQPIQDTTAFHSCF